MMMASHEDLKDEKFGPTGNKRAEEAGTVILRKAPGGVT